MLVPDGFEYLIRNCDAIPQMLSVMPESCVDLLITSPPFPRMFSYSNSESDIGNTENLATDCKVHLGFFYRGLRRVLKPGRVAIVHVMQIPRLKRDGGIGRGLHNFRDLNIRLGERAGLIYEYDWAIRVNPQAQAVRTKSRELQFAGLESDRARSRGALPEFLIKFTAPGDNATPIDDEDEVSRNRWIQLAEHQWESRKVPIDAAGKMSLTLNAAAAKAEGDILHVCPFHLSIVRDMISLFSRRGETVFDPFTGIGSVAFMAIMLGRKAYGTELKAEYHVQAIRNIERAIRMRNSPNRPSLPGFGDGNSIDHGDDDHGDEDAIDAENDVINDDDLQESKSLA